MDDDFNYFQSDVKEYRKPVAKQDSANPVACVLVIGNQNCRSALPKLPPLSFKVHRPVRSGAANGPVQCSQRDGERLPTSCPRTGP